MWLLLPILFLAACGNSQVSSYIDPDFKQLALNFSTEMQVDISDITIIYSNLDPNITGECLRFPDYGLIHINPIYWPRFSPFGKEELLYHELGHCALYLPHDLNLISYKGDNIPASIMFPIAFGEYYYYKDLRSLYKRALRSNSEI